MSYTDLWVCTDCYFAHHYGYHAGDHDDWLVGPDHEYPKDATENEPLGLVRDREVTGNTCSNHDAWEPDATCNECGHVGPEDGIQTFSWQSCQGCGSTLGGAHYRLALHDKEDA